MNIKTMILVSSVGAGILWGAVSDSEIGLRKAPLATEDKTKLEQFSYSKQEPGESQVFDRAFENAPPMIPHNVEGMTDFTQNSNACLDCHSPDVAKDMGATPVPKSHLYDLRNSKAVTDGIADSRWNCTQCHAPQSNAKPLVGNQFKPEYRNKKSQKSSNLLDVINEGVKK
ncbi:nitrate reductase [Helicobacter enhydrae]|uniref:Periplasmic nitrate reductase, electron transfer subunit n=1 Tax=Helicobacter enhydrae TaxID=222136 RepID=A0A1B1U4C2_9HELI|nr:nitrate reductase cytochrome c-type subunit [Helicobacter enhydrae]ANV97644.1 nitrate reductase [Helicobacter enhydrae]